MVAITHDWATGESNDPSFDVSADNMNTHTIDWAEDTDLAQIKPAAAAGSGTTEIPRSDHGHKDSAAGLIYAAMNFV